MRRRLRRKHRIRSGIRTSARIQDLVRVSVKFGLSDWVRAMNLDKSVPGIRSRLGRKDRSKAPVGASRWELLRMALEELGPTFVKLGQLLSNRTDLLPDELISELSKLQDSVHPVDWLRIQGAIESEVGQKPARVFQEIDPTATASASIAQVHRGVLQSGEEVAIKIQRPGIRGTIETDLEILAYLARLADRYIVSSRVLDPQGLVKQFRKHIMQELDFSRERQSMERFRISYEKRRGIRVPKTYPQHCTERMLVMEYMHGVKITEIGTEEAREKLPKYNPAAVARRCADLMLEQVLIHGFFHADPHPGNIMVLPDNVICFLDFGMMGRLHETERRHLVDIIVGVVGRDGAKVTEAILQLTHSTRGMEHEVLVDEVQDIVDDYLDRPLKDVNVAQLFTELISLVVNHGINVPSSLTMVVKALLTVEGVGLNIYPEFTIQPALEGVSRQVLIEQLRPRRLTRVGGQTAMEYANLVRDLPTDLGGLLRQMRAGQLTVGFRLRGLEPLRHTLDNIGYRLIFGVVLAALMISSALIIHARLPPLWNGIPLIGVAGFAIAGILSLGFLFTLIVRVFRRDR